MPSVATIDALQVRMGRRTRSTLRKDLGFLVRVALRTRRKNDLHSFLAHTEKGQHGGALLLLSGGVHPTSMSAFLILVPQIFSDQPATQIPLSKSSRSSFPSTASAVRFNFKSY